MSQSFFGHASPTRRRFLMAAGAGAAGTALGAEALLGHLLTGLAKTGTEEFSVDPYISQEEHLDSLYPPNLSFYKQPWRGYLETVPARQLLNGIGIQYAVPEGTNHEPVIRYLAASGVRRLRIEVGWSNVPWEEDRLTDAESFTAIFAACRQHGLTPLILLNAHHGVPGPNRYHENRSVLSGGQAGSRTVALNSVADLVPGFSGLSNLSDYKMCEALITDIDPGSGRVSLSRPLPNTIPDGATVTVHTLKYRPLYPVGSPEFDHTMGGWHRYVELVLSLATGSEIEQFEVEIWNELSFGSDYLSINNYYATDIVPGDDILRPGGSAWELGRHTTDQVKGSVSNAVVIWGFSNTDYYHNPIHDLPARVDAQSYHPYGTTRKQIPADYPPAEHRPRFMEGFIPELSWCMPEGEAHLGTTPESLVLRLLQPRLRGAERPPEVESFAHAMTEHGFVPREAGVREPNAAQSFKARALIRALPFWLNKGISRVGIYTVYDGADDMAGMLWASPQPPDYGDDGPPPSPALTALRNLTRQFDGSAEIDDSRQLGVRVTSFGDQPQVFGGANGHPPLYYRELFTFLPFQVHSRRFVVATYVMSYDLTSPPPPIRFRLEVTGVDGPRASIRYYDPILDRDLERDPADGYSDTSITATLEQVEYPRLLIVDEGPA